MVKGSDKGCLQWKRGAYSGTLFQTLAAIGPKSGAAIQR